MTPRARSIRAVVRASAALWPVAVLGLALAACSPVRPFWTQVRYADYSSNHFAGRPIARPEAQFALDPWAVTRVRIRENQQ